MNWKHAIFWGLVLGAVIGLALLVTDVLAAPDTTCQFPLEGHAKVNGGIDIFTSQSGEKYFEWQDYHHVGDMFLAGQMGEGRTRYLLFSQHEIYQDTNGEYQNVLYFLVHDQAATYPMDAFDPEEFWVKVDGQKVALRESVTGGLYLWELSIDWEDQERADVDVHVTFSGGETAATDGMEFCTPPTALRLASMDADGGGGAPVNEWIILFSAAIGLLFAGSILLWVEKRK